MQLQALYCALCFRYFLMVRNSNRLMHIVNLCFVTITSNCNCPLLNYEDIFSNCLAVRFCIRFWSCVKLIYAVSMWQKFSYFKNVPQNEIHLHQRYANVLAISLCIVYLKLFPYILIYLPCLSQSHFSQICCILYQLCSRHFSLSPSTICLIKYIINTINIPQFSKKNSALPKTEFCAKLYRSIYFLTILNPLPNEFDNSGQRLTLLK